MKKNTLTAEEFEGILTRTDAFFASYLKGDEKVAFGNFYDKGLDLCRAAIHTKEGRMCGQFDSKMMLFKLAEMLVEASFLDQMSRYDGKGGAPEEALNALLKSKFARTYSHDYFVGNTYQEDFVFPNLWQGLAYAEHFLTELPTIELNGLPLEIVGAAIGADLIKVTCMVLWSAQLAFEDGHLDAIADTNDVMKKLYSLKYGVGLGEFSQEKVKEICESILPWVKNLKEIVVGEKLDVKCFN